MRRHPDKVVHRYRCRAKARVGAFNPTQAWRYSDYTWMILGRFRKMQGLWRAHYHVSETLQEWEAGENALVGAMLVQLLKALHQVALDRGSWNAAALMLLHPDPLTTEDFGGDEWETEEVHKYTKAVRELKAAHKNHTADASSENDSPSEDADDSGKKKKKKKKNLPEDEAKAK